VVRQDMETGRVRTGEVNVLLIPLLVNDFFAEIHR
jgi:hypothetical protein